MVQRLPFTRLEKRHHNSNPPNKITLHRPISLTSTVWKILETVIARRLTSWLEKHKILSPSQAGFWSDRDTTYQILRLFQSANYLF